LEAKPLEQKLSAIKTTIEGRGDASALTIQVATKDLESAVPRHQYPKRWMTKYRQFEFWPEREPK